MTAETDKEFVERIENRWMIAAPEADITRLFALARRGAAMQWMPIETAPKDGTNILVTDGKRQAAAYWWPAVWMGTTHNGMTNPTHFMPLPPPPKGADE